MSNSLHFPIINKEKKIETSYQERPDYNFPQISKNQYTKFATPYAEAGETAFSEKMAEFILNITQEYSFEKTGHIVDLACGVGAACMVFAKHGYSVTGIDLSKEMLDEAKRRISDEKLNITLAQQDMRKFNVNKQANLVTCMYDSLNFMLTETDLKNVFQRIKKTLINNGLFIFDMYTLKGLAEYWGTQCEIHTNTDDFFVTSQTNWDYETQTNVKVMYGFTRKNNIWKRWKEVHVSRAYPLNTICNFLEESGFNVLKMIDWEDPSKGSITKITRRVLMVVQKC